MTNEDEMADPKLVEYLKGEPADVAVLRTNEQGAFPWPSRDNPMLAHLVRQAHEVDPREGDAFIWLAVHAWYEGALAALSRGSDEPPAVDREDVFKAMRHLGVTEVTARRHVEGAMERFAEKRRHIIEGEAL